MHSQGICYAVLLLGFRVKFDPSHAQCKSYSCLLLNRHVEAVNAAGAVIFATYASVQANQLGGATPTYDVYDSDNYPQVCLCGPHNCLPHQQSVQASGNACMTCAYIYHLRLVDVYIFNAFYALMRRLLTHMCQVAETAVVRIRGFTTCCHACFPC